MSKKVFTDHVKDITGITINGKAVDVNALCDETCLAYLCMDIVGELGKRSQLNEGEAKNSKGPSTIQTNADENTQAP